MQAVNALAVRGDVRSTTRPLFVGLTITNRAIFGERGTGGIDGGPSSHAPPDRRKRRFPTYPDRPLQPIISDSSNSSAIDARSNVVIAPLVQVVRCRARALPDDDLHHSLLKPHDDARVLDAGGLNCLHGPQHVGVCDPGRFGHSSSSHPPRLAIAVGAVESASSRTISISRSSSR